ncbi:MAG: hypothetical protein ACM3TU_03150 [Bacillota bacterium]
MTRSHILILIGILTLLAPFSGLPISWLEFVLPVFGLIVAGVGYSYRASKELLPESRIVEGVA